jgi:hypothetical protein
LPIIDAPAIRATIPGGDVDKTIKEKQNENGFQRGIIP